MSQSKQLKKVKLYRTLKVVFYCLGLPLFLFAVFCTTIKFVGADPYLGEAPLMTKLGALIPLGRIIGGPDFYGLWCAVGVWALISIVHIVLAKTVKSRRVRMFAVLALVLVVMVGGTFIMDAVFDAKINDMIANAPAGVTVQDYKTQLSYYTYVSANRKTSTVFDLKNKVRDLKTYYNVDYLGADWSGIAGNIANKPITYANVISDPDENGEVTVGVDICFREKKEGTEFGYELDIIDSNNTFNPSNPMMDNKITAEIEGNQVIRLAPDGNGRLVINGRTYSHYYCVPRTGMSGLNTYLWYAKDMHSIGTEFPSDGKAIHHATDGVYGKALYNESGLIADGWIFSFENVLEILEDYYEGQEELAALEKKYAGEGRNSYQTYVQEIIDDAKNIREAYYSGEQALPSTVVKDENGEVINAGEYCDPWLSALYAQEVQLTENFSLTRGELEYLLSNVGALLGDNSLFDWLLGPSGIKQVIDGVVDDDIIGGLLPPTLGDVLGNALDNLARGSFNLGQFFTDKPETMNTIIEWVKKLTGKDESYAINDIYVVLVYKNVGDDEAIVQKDHLYLALYRDNGNNEIDKTDEGRLLDVDLDDGLLVGGDDDEYNFDLDRLSAFLNNALAQVLDNFDIDIKDGLINTILGLVLKDIEVTLPNGTTEMYKGLVISGISIPLLNSAGEFAIDVNNILSGLLQNWYWYQSPNIKPVWEFYEEVDTSRDTDRMRAKAEIKTALAKYERAVYEGSLYGSIMGSTLIGDTIGGGTYAASFGLTDLASVRQLKMDLSYQPVYFPLYSFRDMMISLSGLVLLFYFLSFVAAEKEELYATGKLLGKVTKKDLEAEMEGAPASVDPDEVSFEDKKQEEASDENEEIEILKEPIEAEGGEAPPKVGAKAGDTAKTPAEEAPKAPAEPKTPIDPKAPVAGAKPQEAPKTPADAKAPIAGQKPQEAPKAPIDPKAPVAGAKPQEAPKTPAEGAKAHQPQKAQNEPKAPQQPKTPVKAGEAPKVPDSKKKEGEVK